MPDPVEWLLTTNRWPPRWWCGNWENLDGWHAIGSSVAIAVCYFAIPFLGWWLLRRKPHLAPDRGLARLALWFVLLCGATHMMDAVMFWWPAYRLTSLTRDATAVVSAAALLRLWAVRNRLLSYASPEEYRKALGERDAALVTAAVRERQLREEFERKARQNDRFRAEADALRDELAGVLHRVVTDEDYQRLRARLHNIRGTQ